MATAASIFRFPVRSADVWGLNDEQQRSNDDIAADLDFQDNAVEDYLSNELPTLYTQLDLTTGTIDPTQLAGGTPGAGKAPVGSPPTWTDIATQGELDAHTGATTSVHGIADTSALAVLGTNVQRGSSALTMNGTTTTRAVVFGTTFGSVPVVVTTPLVGSDQQPAYVDLTANATTGFTYRITLPTSSTTTAIVYWVAITP